jgi:hypothetical protein
MKVVEAPRTDLSNLRVSMMEELDELHIDEYGQFSSAYIHQKWVEYGAHTSSSSVGIMNSFSGV